MHYTDWLQTFTADKRLVGSSPLLAAVDAIHSVSRYIANDGYLWEVAQTYTGRVVIRRGELQDNQVTIEWATWVTLHEVQIHDGV